MRVAAGFVRSDTIIDNKPYARWQGRLTAGQSITLEFPRSGTPGWMIPMMIALMGLVLIGVTVQALR